MIFQIATSVANAVADAFEASIGTGVTLEFWAGAMPIDTMASPTGSLLGSAALDADWMSPATTRAKTILGAWSVITVAAGDISYFRLTVAGVCKAQGDVTVTGGGGALTVAALAVVLDQAITVTSASLVAGNA